MRIVKKLSDINFTIQETVIFMATVIDIQDEGDEAKKRPMRFGLKFEESGENITAISWSFNFLDDLKKQAKTAYVSEFEALAGIFKEQQQFRVGNFKQTDIISTKKVVRTVDITGIKREIQTIVNRYIKTPIIKNILEEFILNNSKFYDWPAAKSIHHAYEGGLATHSLNVCKQAIATWEIYSGQNLDIEVLVAGALLHDIGKLYEYNRDGSHTTFGELMPHLVIGSEEISKFCFSLGIDSNRDTKILMIKHIILSHHEKLEQGSPATPKILEAVVIAKADALDATTDALNESLANLTVGAFSDRMMVLDGDKILKWS